MKRKRARREEVKRNALVQSINRRDEKRSLAPNNLKAELRSCLEKKTRGFATIPSPRTHSGDACDRTRKGGLRGSVRHSQRGVGTAPHRREEAPVEMGDVRGARAASSPRYARARSSGTRAPPTARRVSALLRSRDGGVRRANLARGLSPSASRRATLTRPPTFRADHSSTPDCPRSCGGSARCARARTSSRASATNPRVARRRRRASSPTSSRATRGKPCVRRASEDAMSCRCVSDFAAISREGI